jgi:aryl-alcohol dehydrogenase-like predicted oxidoreductase
MATAGPTTKLGDDLTASALGFGAGALAAYGDADDAESLATLNRCLDLGVTFIDTANVYGGGSNERLIARLLAGRRDEAADLPSPGDARHAMPRFAGAALEVNLAVADVVRSVAGEQQATPAQVALA